MFWICNQLINIFQNQTLSLKICEKTFWENGAHLKFIFLLVPVSDVVVVVIVVFVVVVIVVVDVDKLSLSGQSSLTSTFVKELCLSTFVRKTQFLRT